MRDIRFTPFAFITLLAIAFVFGNIGQARADSQEMIALWGQLVNSTATDSDGDGLPDDLENASNGEFDAGLCDTNADGIDDLTAFMMQYLSNGDAAAVADAAAAAGDAADAAGAAEDAANAAADAQATAEAASAAEAAAAEAAAAQAAAEAAAAEAAAAQAAADAAAAAAAADLPWYEDLWNFVASWFETGAAAASQELTIPVKLADHGEDIHSIANSLAEQQQMANAYENSEPGEANADPASYPGISSP